MKIAINKCYGGFGVSDEFRARYFEKTGRKFDSWNIDTRKIRTDPVFIELVESMGEAASGSCSELRIVEIPDGVTWYIDDYDGIESIHEEHRSWG